MNLKFVVNDYILIWNLLFQASPSEMIYKLKQKLWINYQGEYNKLYQDKELILKDAANFIPNDDTIYNIVLESKEYEKVKKATERYRIDLLKLWDASSKKINKYLPEILKIDFEKYTIMVVDEKLDVLDTTSLNEEKDRTIILGKQIDKKDPNKLVLELLFDIVKKEIKTYSEKDQMIADAIIEMAIYNELLTRVTTNSSYFKGRQNLTYIKRQIYPYWLMYLGIKIEELQKYMLRDKVSFDLEKYPYEKALIKMTIKEFIDFCIKNKKHMIKEEQLELI